MSSARFWSRSIPTGCRPSGLTAVNVSQILRGTNVDLAGGRAEIGKNDQAIRTLAGAKTLNELAGTMIPLFGGGEMRLDDLGTVTDTIADRGTFARFNGEPVVALGIKRSKGASDVVVADAVQKRIDALKVAYPDVDLKLIDTSVDFTKGNYHAAISTLFEGAILAVIVVLLFLRDLRATIIAAISLPLSIFPAFWVDGHARLLAEPGLASSPSRCRPVFWSTTPSSRSRTSCATCAWASRPIAPRSKPPTKSASP